MIIGPTFASELKAAGLNPEALAFEGDAKTDIRLVTTLNAAQQATFDAVVAAHDPAAKLPDQIREDGFRADAQVQDLFNRLKNADQGQIDQWFANNITTAQQAIPLLKSIVKVLAIKLQRDT